MEKQPKLDYSDIKFKDNGKLKLIIVVGTRPEIIRLAAVITKCRQYFDVILAHTGQNYIKVFSSLVDDRCQANDLRAGANNDQQLQLAVILKRYTTIISHCFSPLTPAQRRCPGASGQRSRCRS